MSNEAGKQRGGKREGAGGQGCSGSKESFNKMAEKRISALQSCNFKTKLDQAVATDCGVLFCQMMPATVAGLLVVVVVVVVA